MKHWPVWTLTTASLLEMGQAESEMPMLKETRDHLTRDELDKKDAEDLADALEREFTERIGFDVLE